MKQEETRLKNLKLFLKIFGFFTILVMSINMSAFVFQMEAFRPGNSMHWLLWDDITGHVGPMIFIIYIVWGIYFFKVAKDPLKHKSFLDFTMWANLAHGLIMIPMAIQDPTYHLRFLTDIPFILLTAVGIYLWRPLPEGKSAYTN
jgi:hypothetical protein